jgi:hypothetical protein
MNVPSFPFCSGLTRQRLVSAVLFFFVFFLPLHLHPYTSTPEVQKECSCLHGNRTQLGSLPDLVPAAPLLWASFLVPQEPVLDFSCSFELRTIRAPPSIYSL